MIQTTWDKQESGWYTHRKFGGICKEDGGRWYWYPPPEWWKMGLGEIFKKVGPFDTLREAKDSAERAPLHNPQKA